MSSEAREALWRPNLPDSNVVQYIVRADPLISGGFVTSTRNPEVQPAGQRRDLGSWIRTHAVALTGLGCIAAQLGWTTVLLSRSYFRQGDFAMLDGTLHDGFGWSYLMRIDAGHLEPAGQAITFVLARNWLYDWGVTGAVLLIGVAAASLAMLRMLLTVFARADGSVPRGILLPFAVYLFSPLSAGAVASWSQARWLLPLELAMFMAVTTHVRYLRDGNRRHLAAASAWVVLAMLSADQGALVPVLLFGLTAAYFEPGRLSEAARLALTRHRQAWMVYGMLLAGYCALFFAQLSGSGADIAGPGKATSLYEFAGTLIGVTAVPALFGGPWQWLSSGYATAGPPPAVEYLSWAGAFVVVLASCLWRPRAWRAWALLLGWILAADIAPAAIGGFRLFATALGRETGYLADATGVLALCLGLAFLPVRPAMPALPAGEAGEAGEGDAEVTPKPVRAVALAAFGCFAAGAIVSLQAFGPVVSASAIRSYIATARHAVTQVPRGTVIVSGPTPAAVMNPGFFPGQATTAQVIGPLTTRVTWLPVLSGVLDAPTMLDAAGRLRPVAVAGVSVPGPACRNVTSAGAAIPLNRVLYRWSWTARLGYSGPAGMLWVSLGAGGSQQVAVPAGRHVVYVPIAGSGKTLSLQFADDAALGKPLCVTGVTVGLPGPARS